MGAVVAGLMLARAFASGDALPTWRNLPTGCKAAFDRAKKTLEAKLRERVAVTLELEPRGQAAVRDDLFSHWVSLLDRKRKVLVVDTARLEALLAKAKTTRQRADGLFVLMLHELIHAYQDRVLASHPHRTVNGKWLRFVCEGHALHFSRKIALECGVKGDLVGETAEGQQERPVRGSLVQIRNRLLHDFFYRLSAVYVAGKCKELKDFVGLLREAPTFAEILGKGLIVPDPGPAKKWIMSHQSQGATVGPPLEVDYLDMIVLLCPEEFRNPVLADAFSGGAYGAVRSPGGLTWELGALNCRDEAGAREWFKQALRSFSGRGEVALKLLTENQLRVEQFPRRGRFFTVLRLGRRLVCLDFPSSKEGRLAQAWVMKALR